MAYYENKSSYPHPPPPQYTPNANPIQQPPSYIVEQQRAMNIVHIQTTTAVGPDPTMIVCPSCRNNVMTRLEYESSSRTHLMALGLCLLGLWPCVCIPYCVDSCQNCNHYCPSCGAFIGAYRS